RVIRRIRCKKLDAINGWVRRRSGYCRSLVRDNARDIGKNRGRGRKRCAEKGSARLHESLRTRACTDNRAIETQMESSRRVRRSMQQAIEIRSLPTLAHCFPRSFTLITHLMWLLAQN